MDTDLDTDLDGIGAMYAKYTLKKSVAKFLHDRENILGDLDERKKSDALIATRIVQLYEEDFGTYCREMLMFHEHYNRYPDLTDYQRMSEYTYSDRIQFIQTCKRGFKNEHFLFLCPMICQAYSVLSDEKAFDDIVDDVMEKILCRKLKYSIYSTEKAMKAFYATERCREEGIDDDLEDEGNENDYDTEDVEMFCGQTMSEVLRPGFDNLPLEEFDECGSKADIVYNVFSREMKTDIMEHRVEDLVPADAVLEDGSIPIAIDISVCSEDYKRILLMQKNTYDDRGLSACRKRPKVLIITKKENRRYGRCIISIGGDDCDVSLKGIRANLKSVMSGLWWRMWKQKLIDKIPSCSML